ncbi:MAG: hypothetical protein IKR75_01955, partial [Fibrobacter sp.]|nr:hypothetical protein [Fibrobacter sp.]
MIASVGEEIPEQVRDDIRGGGDDMRGYKQRSPHECGLHLKFSREYRLAVHEPLGLDGRTL